MVERFQRLMQTENQIQVEIERCEREIADIEYLLLAGHPDVEGLTLALHDWSAELRILNRRTDSK
jgi:hypothetical protein